MMRPIPTIEVDDLIHYEKKDGKSYSGIVVEKVGDAVYTVLHFPYGRSQPDILDRLATVFIDEVTSVMLLYPIHKKAE